MAANRRCELDRHCEFVETADALPDMGLGWQMPRMRVAYVKNESSLEFCLPTS